MKFEANNINEGAWLTGVALEKGNEKVSLVQVTLERLQDDVQHTIGIERKPTWTPTSMLHEIERKIHFTYMYIVATWTNT